LPHVLTSMVLMCFCVTVHAQGSTSMGTEFWTAYMANTNPPGGDQGSKMFLYITSNVNTSGNIAVIDGSFSENFIVTANQVTIVQIPPTAYISGQGATNQGIHITSLQPVAIYAHIFANSSSGATLLLPVNTMGKSYYSLNYTQTADETAYSAFLIIATEDSTTVQITPSANNEYLQPQTVSLNKGQVFQLLNSKDLTGTTIQSISTGTSACKKIAVFSGSTRIAIGCPDNSSDNLFQQIYPTAVWGKDYITVPLKNRSYDVFRVFMSDPNTNLVVNGQAIPAGSFAQTMYYQFNSTVPNIITADQPVQVIQYAVTQEDTENCIALHDDIGDPEMILLTPTEQTLNQVTLYSTSNYAILQSYINVLIKSEAVSSFVLDGEPYTQFTPVPNDPTYAYAQIMVPSGTHNISASEGFNAIAYGFGQHESYGYAAGANLENLNEFIALKNLQTDSLQVNGCTGENYNLQITLPYETSNITWDFKNGTTPYQQSNPVMAKTEKSGTQTLYVYNYPKNPVNFQKGDHTIVATVTNPTADNCGSTEQVQFDFNISDFPVVNFAVDNTYVGAATSFTDETTSDTTIKSWSWNFGDNQTSGVQNPVHTYASPGKYTVSETVTDVDGCASSIQKVINVAIVTSPVTGTIGACAGTASSDPDIQNFLITAGNLTAGLVITAPKYFEVSLSEDSGYAGSINIPQRDGTVTNTEIYIRSAAVATEGNINGVVTVSSTGSTSVNLPVSGIVNSLASIDTVASQTVKNGHYTTAVTFTGTSNTFAWVNDSPQIGLPANGAGNIASFKAINNNGATPIVATITVTPESLTYAYIANSNQNTVSVVNTVTNTVVSTINVGSYPLGVATASNGLVYVSNYKDGTISVINTNTNTVRSTFIAGSGPFGIVVSPNGKFLYAANALGNNVTVINTANGSSVAVIPVGTQPVGIAITADGSQLFVSNSKSNSITVINTATNQVVATINVGGDPEGMEISPDGGVLYEANSNANTVDIISTSNYAIEASITVGSNPFGVAVSPDGSKIYVTNSVSNTVSVISTVSNTVTATINVGQVPYGIATNPDGSMIYVANQGSNTASIIDAQANTVISTLQTQLAPSSLGNFIVAGTGCTGNPVKFHITISPTLPVLLTATGPLSSLSTTYGTPSASGSFTVSAANTVSTVTIASPVGFEISTDDISFSPVIMVGDSGTVAATPIYVRLKATTPVGTYPNDTIKISSDNADTLKTMIIPLGTVLQASLTIKADDKQRPYGVANPELTLTYTGFVNNEKPSDLTTQPQTATTATITSMVGVYPITVSGGLSPNYVFSYVFGTLNVQPSLSLLSIPNTFTPNGDGINDTWDIKYLNYYPNCTVEIFSRYGEKLYSSVGYSIPWDGTYKGSALPTGTYYYIINLRDGNPPLSGYIAIIK
jgi:gliding motility-associated-like protein